MLRINQYTLLNMQKEKRKKNSNIYKFKIFIFNFQAELIPNFPINRLQLGKISNFYLTDF